VVLSTAKNMIEGLGYRVLAARTETLEMLGQQARRSPIHKSFMPDGGMHGPELVAAGAAAATRIKGRIHRKAPPTRGQAAKEETKLFYLSQLWRERRADAKQVCREGNR
jgi:hypothetical protein